MWVANELITVANEWLSELITVPMFLLVWKNGFLCFSLFMYLRMITCGLIITWIIHMYYALILFLMFSYSLATYTKRFITTIVLKNDIFPR